MLDRYPQLYRLGQTSKFYNSGTFWSWIANSFFHSLIMYYGLSSVYGESSMRADGLVVNNWVMGEMIYTADLIVITLKAALIVDTWVRFTVFAIFGSIALWFVLFPIYGLVGPMVNVGSELHGMSPMMFTAGAFWFGILLIPVTANLRDYTWKQ